MSIRGTTDPRRLDTSEDVQAYLTSLVATRVLKEDPCELARCVEAQNEARRTEQLQRRSGQSDPSQARPGQSLNRRQRKAQGRKRRLAKVVQAMVERARDEGADPDWVPEAFPALDWRIKSEATAIMRDVTGRRARIFAAGLPPAQAERLLEEAERLGPELDEACASLRWRELVAAAWVSWRLSRPIRASRRSKREGRENQWAGGRVVDGYARQAFCLLMRDLQTGRPMSMSKLFYRNGSGVQGVFGYLARSAPAGGARGLPRIDGCLGLYSRFQPRADKSRYVGPPKMTKDGQPLLDANGQPQRYALAEHWYHRSMCGRRAASQSDRGSAAARSILHSLCPWLFDDEPCGAIVLSELEHRDESVGEGPVSVPMPSPCAISECPGLPGPS